MESMTFISACRKFFGPKPGQTLKEFADEVKTVQGKDREDFIEMFRTVEIDATKVS